MKVENKLRCLSIFLVLGVAFAGLAVVSATGFGVVSQYSEENVLEMYPGQTADAYFKVQNTIPGAEPLRVEAVFLEGSEIASLVGSSEFDVAVGEQEQVDVRVSIPNDANIGGEYIVKLMFNQISPVGGEGSVQFGVNIGESFKVVVIEEPEGVSSGGNFWIWVIAIIILVIIIWAVMMKKSNASTVMKSPSDTSMKSSSNVAMSAGKKDKMMKQ